MIGRTRQGAHKIACVTNAALNGWARETDFLWRKGRARVDSISEATSELPPRLRRRPVEQRRLGAKGSVGVVPVQSPGQPESLCPVLVSSPYMPPAHQSG
jgi:hypothetical protein